MPFQIRNISLPLGSAEADLPCILSKRLAIPAGTIRSCDLIRKGIDARRKGQIHFVCTLRFTVDDEQALLLKHAGDPDLALLPEEPAEAFPRVAAQCRVVIVGTGPAGLFAALRLAEYGLCATLLERGKPVDERLRDVQEFWGRALLNPESNVQFGEGGAGTFSDGKLTTRVRDRRIAYILDRLVAFGAPPEIAWLAKPHIGTDRLRAVLVNLRRHLESSGSQVLFSHRLSDLVVSGDLIRGVVVNDVDEFPCDYLILAPGHSARDTYRMLDMRGVALEQKPFAVGVRIEHPQELINRIQYGVPGHPQLPPADYALAWNAPQGGRSAYSFCMCPGGVVVAGSSEPGGVVTNGMSNHLRNSPYANSALVVTVGRHDFPDESPLAGITFQRRLEAAAFAAGGGAYRAPAQKLPDFLGQRQGGSLRSSYRPGVREVDLHEVLPDYITATLREGIQHFNRKMRGFISSEATLTGVETRTSAPLRILRGEDLQSVTCAGLYPAGEGAGYAGGIMSAALDGIRVADAIASRVDRQGPVHARPEAIPQWF